MYKRQGVRDSAAVLALTGMGHRVLVLSAWTGRAEVHGALAAGARGYLSKHADGVEIVRAVHEIAAGNRYLSSSIANAVLDVPGRRGGGSLPELSDREREVLGRLALGERDQDIACALAISVRTVRSYLDRVRDKTGLRRRPELTRYAIEHGVVADERACGGDRVSA